MTPRALEDLITRNRLMRTCSSRSNIQVQTTYTDIHILPPFTLISTISHRPILRWVQAHSLPIPFHVDSDVHVDGIACSLRELRTKKPNVLLSRMDASMHVHSRMCHAGACTCGCMYTYAFYVQVAVPSGAVKEGPQGPLREAGSHERPPAFGAIFRSVMVP